MIAKKYLFFSIYWARFNGEQMGHIWVYLLFNFMDYWLSDRAIQGRNFASKSGGTKLPPSLPYCKKEKVRGTRTPHTSRRLRLWCHLSCVRIVRNFNGMCRTPLPRYLHFIIQSTICLIAFPLDTSMHVRRHVYTRSLNSFTCYQQGGNRIPIWPPMVSNFEGLMSRPGSNSTRRFTAPIIIKRPHRLAEASLKPISTRRLAKKAATEIGNYTSSPASTTRGHTNLHVRSTFLLPICNRPRDSDELLLLQQRDDDGVLTTER
jgi:hypothetical protein